MSDISPFATFLKRRGLAGAKPLEEGTPGMDVIARRAAALEAELADHLEAEGGEDDVKDS